MKIIESLKQKDNTIRLTNGNNYMYWNTISNEWVVVTNFRNRCEVILVMTPDEDLAIKILKGIQV